MSECFINQKTKNINFIFFLFVFDCSLFFHFPSVETLKTTHLVAFLGFGFKAFAENHYGGKNHFREGEFGCVGVEEMKKRKRDSLRPKHRTGEIN